MNADDRQRATKAAVVFVVLAISFTWLYWVAVLLARAGVLPFSMEHDGFFLASVPGTIIWSLLRGFGPALAGVLALAICRGRASVVALGRSLIRWRVGPWLYLAGWLGLITNGAVVATGYLLGRIYFTPGTIPFTRFVPFFVLMALLDGPLGEEIGWRGVLLPQLMQRWKAIPAALVVGVVWYVWHIPLYLADGKAMSLPEHGAFLYSCLLLSIILTWFVLKSNGSTLMAIYVHNCWNYSIFLRSKLFVFAGSPTLPRVVGFGVMTIIAAAATMALWRMQRDGGEEWRVAMSPSEIELHR